MEKLDAEIAEYFARQSPKNPEAQQKAQQARTQARESAEAAGEADSFDDIEPFIPSENLKKLYHDIARRIHPDMADDPEEKKRRDKSMAESST